MLREIQPTLGPGAQGPDVVNLQEALIALGESGWFRSSDPPVPYEPPPPPGGPTLQPTAEQLGQFLKVVADRRRFQTYESATETLVAWFQAQAALSDPPGVVEAATANRLNLELRERRLFPEGVQHSIVGQVRKRPSGIPLADILVRASLLTGRDTLRLGDTRTDASGAYAIPLDAANLISAVPPGATIPILLQLLDGQDKLIAETQHNAPPDAALIRIDMEVGALDPEVEERPDPPFVPGPQTNEAEGDGDRFLVRGTVRFADGKPMGGALVMAYDVDLRSLSPLGDPATTSPEGAYEIPYTQAQFAWGEKRAADLLLRLFEPGSDLELLTFSADDGSGQPIATLLLPQTGDGDTPRAVCFNAPAVATIDLTLQATEAPPSEWLAIAQAVVPLLGDLWPHELNDTDRVFLERETQLSREQLQAWILAAQAAEAINLLNDESLAPFAEWLAPIRESSGTRPSAYLVEWIAFYGWFREEPGSDARQLLQSPSDGLIQRLLSAANRNTIPDLQTQGAGDRPLLEVIREALDRNRLVIALEPAPEGQPASIGDILNAVGADWLAPELRVRVAQAWPTLNPDELEFEATLAILEVAAMDRPKLAQTLRLDHLTLHHPGMITALQAHVPPQPEAFSPEATLNGLTTLEPDQWLDLVYTCNTPAGSLMAPEDYARHLGKEAENSLPTLSLLAKIDSGKRLLHPEHQEAIVTLLQQPGFNIVAADLGEIAENKEVPEVVLADLHRLQALKQAGASWDLTQSLLDRGIDSMDKIVNIGRRSLEDLLAGDPHAGEIADVHDTAVMVGSMGMGLFNAIGPAIWGVGTAVMGSQSPTAPQLADNATVRRLFGALEQCACEPCLSVLSPAAYFVDLLRYVDSNPMAAYTLKQRRPDLYDLELSCDNTQIELPQIDLALEILENAVALPRAIALSSGTNAENQLQTNQIGAEIRACLQETALDDIGPLTATADQWTILPTILEPGATYWVIADRYRRWVVKAQREAFGIDVLVALSQGVNLTGINVGSLPQWMNQGPHFPVPAESWRPAILQMLSRMSSFEGTPLPASLTQLTVTTLEEDRRWRVDYAVAGTIQAQPVAPSFPGIVEMTYTSSDGSLVNRRIYFGAGSTLAALNAGSLGGALAAYNFPSNSIQVQTTASGWTYTQTLSEEVIYSPASLTIEGMSYQSTANDRNLLVRPQNQNPLAYELLGESTRVFPWTLPYDLALTETRALLDEAGHSRLELLEAALPDSEQFVSDLWAREQLGLSKGETEAILTSRSGDDLWRTWGLRPAGNSSWSVFDTYSDAERVAQPLDPSGEGLLQSVSVVLQQARLRFVELQAILAMPFVHGGQTLSLEPIVECDPTKIWIKGIDAGVLDRLHRMIRLWRALDWSIWEVDLVLTSLGVKATNALLTVESLRRLAQLQALKAHLHLPVEVLATLFAGFGDRIYSAIDLHETLQPIVPLYQRIFLRKPLQPTQQQTSPPPSLAFAQTLPILDDALLAVIATALGARPADLKGLLESRVRDLQPIKWNAPLPLNQNGNQKGLLHLWRNTVLAKALGLPWNDYLAASRLLEAEPFASPASLLLFCREVQFMAETGVHISALERALTNQQTPEGQDPWLLPVEMADGALSSLQTGLQAIATPEPQPLRPLGLTEDELRAAPFRAPVDAAERWRRWGLKPKLNSTTEFSVPSPYPAPAGSTPPVPPLTGTPLALLNQVSVLAQQASLSSSELKAVLQTRYVAPDAQSLTELSITNTAGQPEVLNALTDASLATYLDRIERLVALERALTVPTPELDLLIETLGAATNLANLLREDGVLGKDAAASIFTIRDRLTLPLDGVMAWWGGLVGRQVVVFERLFVPTLPGQRWRLNVAGTALDTPPSNWREAIPSLASAFAVDPSDVSYLIEAGIVQETVNLANLAVLHHWLSLAKALGIPTRLLHYLRNRFFPTLSPSTVPAPAKLLEFLTEISPLKQKIDLVIQQLAAASELEPGITCDLLLDHLSINSSAGQQPALDFFLTPGFSETASNSATVNSSPAYGVLIKLRKVAWLNTVWKADRERLRWLRRFSWFPAFQGVISDHFHGEGLVGEYFTNPTLIPPAAHARLDAVIDFQWEARSPAPGLGSDLFSIRWRGQLQAPATGTFTFTTRSDDGVRLWVNGQPLIDNWTDHLPTEDSGTINLVADQRYDIVLEYYERQGDATIEFYWSAPALGIARQLVKALHPVIPYLQWKQTTQLYEVLSRHPQLQSVLEDYRFSLGPSAQRTNVNQARTVLGAAFGLSLDDVNWCAIQWQMDTTASLALNQADWMAQTDPIRISGVLNLLATLQKLGLTTSELKRTALLDELPAPAAATLAQRILRSRYGEGTWEEAFRRVNNRLRIQQRDRLVDHLLWEKKLTDANSLYEHYLIDVQMAPCMRTTRLLQSTAAVQLYIQRCLMNLEPNVLPGSFDAKRWEWMQYYRIWEASRNVFLYPENWLFYELRDNQSELFRAWLGEISQNRPSHETATEAIKTYANGLLDISQIVVMGLHEDVAYSKRTVYLVGRSLNSPFTYYWRKAESVGKLAIRWHPWESISQELSQTHVVPFVLNGDFCIAWPMIRSRQASTIDEEGQSLYEISLAWIRHTNKGWSPPRESIDKLEVEKLSNRNEESRVLFRLDEFNYGDDVVRIEAYQAEPINPRVAPPLNKQSAYIPPFKVPGRVPDIKGTAEVVEDIRKRSVVRLNLSAFEQYSDTKILSSSPCKFWLQGFRSSEGPPDPHISHYLILGSAGNWVELPATSTTFMLLITSVDNAVQFKIVAESSSAHIIRDVSNSQFNQAYNTSYIESGFYSILIDSDYEITWHAVFSAGPDPSADNKNMNLPLKMNRKGCFKLFSDRDVKWEGGNSLLRPQSANTLSPPANSIFSSSGLLEIPSASSVYIDSYDGYRLSNQASSELFMAVRSSKSLATLNNPAFSSSRNWQVEEGSFKMLINISQSTALSISLACYNEAHKILRLSNQDPSLAFALNLQPSFVQQSFGQHLLPLYYPVKLLGANTSDPRDSPLLPFDEAMPYALYNWEFFYHLPMAAASFLSKQHRYSDARRWFHYIFDPTSDDPSQGRERFWRLLPFRHTGQVPTIVQLLNTLSDPKASANEKQHIQDQIDAWLADPFNPFAVARLRTSAFEMYTINAYIKNLVDWGDQLFRRDTRESINEATLLYVMAAQILGRRPEQVPSRFGKGALSFRSIQGQWDAFSNTWISLAPFLRAWIEYWKKFGGINPAANQQMIDALQKLASIGSTYFCVPPNEKILELWDLVADRLFKIRNCQNIDGVIRDLPLFDPPIDPELLIRARRAGLDLADVLSDRYAPLPIYRFQAQMQKANELCSEVKALGSALITAMEKKEVEHLALLRSNHELTMHKLVEQVKQDQINEAAANIEALKKTRINARDRVIYLQRQLGNNDVGLDAQDVPIVEQTLITQVQGSLDFTGDEDGLALINREVDQIGWLNVANNWSLAAGSSKASAGVFHALAVINAGLAASAIGDGFGVLSSNAKTWEQWNGQIAAWQRRRDDWVHQSRTTVEEIRQLDKQIAALEIRKVIADKELANQRKQIEQTREIDDYIRSQKLSRESLYSWMESELASAYFTAYQHAFEQAKRAERTFRFELGDETTNFIQYGHWDGLRKGLMAGEQLAQDLRRMDVAYLERNRRELEISKHISLLLLDPLKLIELRSTGSCEITIPERLFDLDFPGHFFRRIKTVSLSIPCVVGPFTSINATLTLLSSQLRDTSQVKGGSYDSPDNYRSSYLPIQSIATSSAQNDSGLFELNFRDERYLPFEGAGAISTWRLSLPSDFRQFDYDTISDVILHLRYTARDAGSSLKTSAVANLKQSPVQADPPPLFLLLQPRQDFPSQWQRFLTPATAGSEHTLALDLKSDLFPFRDAKRSLKVTRIWLFARCDETNQTDSYTLDLKFSSSTSTSTLQISSFPGFHTQVLDLDLTLNSQTSQPLTITIARQGGNVAKEVKDLVLILGYEWEGR